MRDYFTAAAVAWPYGGAAASVLVLASGQQQALNGGVLIQ